MTGNRDLGAETPLHRRIAALMTRAGIRNPSELAEKAGVSAGAIYAFWQGKTKRPHPRTLEKLARALGVETDVVLGEGDLASIDYLEDPVRVTLLLDGHHFDVFQAVAASQRLSPSTVIEGELAQVAERLAEDPNVRGLIDAIGVARAQTTNLSKGPDSPP